MCIVPSLRRDIFLTFSKDFCTAIVVDARIFSFKGGLRIPENKVSVLTLPLSTQHVGSTLTNEISKSHPTGTFELGSCDTCRIVSFIIDYVAKVRMSPYYVEAWKAHQNAKELHNMTCDTMRMQFAFWCLG